MDEVVRPAVGVLVDKALLHRRFEDIVNQLTESGDFPQNLPVGPRRRAAGGDGRAQPLSGAEGAGTSPWSM